MSAANQMATMSICPELPRGLQISALKDSDQCIGMKCHECYGFFIPNVPLGHIMFGKMQPCERTKQQVVERMQAECGLNPSERKILLKSVVDTGGATNEIVRSACAFRSNPVYWLTVWGGVGNGKTSVLQGIVNECMLLGIPAMYATFFQLVEWVREGYREDAAMSARERLNKLCTIKVLAVDELEKIKSTDKVDELRFALFDQRYRDGIAGLSGTVLAMNCDPESLPDWLSSRIFDGRNIVRHNDDPDVRPVMDR